MTRKFLMLAFLISATAFAQYEYRDSNRIGISFGLNQFTLNTDDFTTNPENGWNAGLSMRGNFYNNWDMVYSMQFSENNFTVDTKKNFVINEAVNYKLQSVQIGLQLSYKIIPDHLSVEFGPVFQLNGDLKIDSASKNNIISGTTLFANDIVEISKFNFLPTVGITTGVRHFRLSLFYQYGINNMLENLNSKDLGVNFKGNPGIINGNLIVYL